MYTWIIGISVTSFKTIQESEIAKHNPLDIIQVCIALEIPVCSWDLPWFIAYAGGWICTK